MILADALPGFKLFLRKAHLSEAGYGHALAFVATFLLLTAGGLRLPYWLPYYTQDYARAIDRAFRTEAQLGAELIRQVQVPEGAVVVVVGDTAYEAECVKQACAERHFLWVLPVNPE